MRRLYARPPLSARCRSTLSVWSHAVSRATALAILALASTASSGCLIPNPGVSPPEGELNFPISVALLPGASPADPSPFLVVANTNADVRYGAGSLQSFRLEGFDADGDGTIAPSEEGVAAILADLSTRCPPPAAGRCAPYRGTPDPARCGTAECAPCMEDGICRIPCPWCLIQDEVQLDSQADGIEIGRSGGRYRAYLPVRARPSITHVDIDPSTGELTCEGAGDGLAGFSQAGGVHRCDDAHRARRGRDLSMPVDPVAIAVAPAAEYGVPDRPDTDLLIVAHRNGVASLFADDGSGPALVDTLEGLAFDMVEARFDPTLGAAWLTSAAFDPRRTTRDMSVVGVGVSRGELSLARVGILRVDSVDQRDVLFDGFGETAWLLTRAGDLVRPFDRASFPFGVVRFGSVAVSVDAGPMRLRRADIGGRTYLLVTCYDGRSIVVVDVTIASAPRRVATVVGFSSPTDMAIDPVTMRAYVNDFRDSVIAVVDLSPLLSREAPRIVARLGTSRPPTLFAR